MVEATPEPRMITISEYILERLHQIGVTAMFGIPGDFTLKWLDYVEDDERIRWVGTCNEMNAAMAAEGYARISRTLGVLSTTFGVGELTAINGLANAYAERIPLLSIVGSPLTSLTDQKAMLHHSFGDGTFDKFVKMAEPVTVAQAILHPSTLDLVAGQIDHVIKPALLKSRPTYLLLPLDMVSTKIDGSGLDTPFDLKELKASRGLPNDVDVFEHVLKRIMALYVAAADPILVIDACAVRFDMLPLVRELVDVTGMPFYLTPMSKAALDENHPQFGGIYLGSPSDPEIAERFHASDLVISIGRMRSDCPSVSIEEIMFKYNCLQIGGFAIKPNFEFEVELHSCQVTVQYATYDKVNFFTMLPSLLAAFKTLPKRSASVVRGGGLALYKAPIAKSADQGLTHELIWPLITAHLKPYDAIVCEVGSSTLGLIDAKLPVGATVETSMLWASIGWAAAATLGAALAAQEAGRRCVLVTGEGSLQETAQDLSTTIRNGLKPLIIVLNNNGYGIERQIHGPNRIYNDVAAWDWQLAMPFFGAKAGEFKTWSVKTEGELMQVMQDTDWQDAKPNVIQFLELHLPPLDAPKKLQRFCNGGEWGKDKK